MPEAQVGSSRQASILPALVFWAVAMVTLLPAVKPAAASQPLSNIASVSAGGSHTCALTSAGGVKCWGSQLGGGASAAYSTYPADVPGLASGVTAVASGVAHACAVTTAGSAKCWGSNDEGQLGDGTFLNRPAPVNVSGLASGVASIGAGYSHTCALTSGGGVKCWGFNFFGQLGDGTTTDRATPRDVTGLTTGVAAIAVAGDHACALTAAGGVKCWGSGPLGDGTNTPRPVPVDVSGLASGVAAISAGGEHTCALTIQGAVKCWGVNAEGQLGDNTTTQRLTPVDVPGLTNGVRAISAGQSHSCALTDTGGVKCWGFNYFGQVGDGTTRDRLLPAAVTGLATGVAAISAGGDHTCALTSAGDLRCWGDNGVGQVGNGTASWRSSPVDVASLGGPATAVAAGWGHSCAAAPGGMVKCWGHNGGGELGDGTALVRVSPTSVPGLAGGATAVSARSMHSCALTSTGGVRCWGSNSNGQLGNGSTAPSTAPVDVAGLASGVVAISAGADHTCALTAAGAVKCWGLNTFGQLGNGTTTSSATPVAVSGLGSGVTAIATGLGHSCALISAGGLKCWGSNGFGQLGDNTYNSRPTPGEVVGLATNAAAVAAGDFHTCAVATGGEAKCWGLNDNGALGDGTRTLRTLPVTVSGLASGVSALAAGSSHTCALTTVGGVTCWGSNAWGQVGDGAPLTLTPNDQRLTPVFVAGLASGVTSIAAGRSHTCAITTTGAAKCWGNNQWGQLGEGTANYASPLTVITTQQMLSANVEAVVTSFYDTILGRAPDGAGKAFWVAEATRVSSLGADVKEAFYAMSIAFFASTEYVGRKTSDDQYIIDLYRTFFGRDPDTGGLAYWLGELNLVRSRSALLNSFLFSTEFANKMAALFQTGYIRPEVNMTVDFFRGALGRLPDSEGFAYWLGEIRKAQCAGASAVSSKVSELASLFFGSAEYAQRNRGDRDFIGDVYNAYLRRGPGGDSAGFNYWLSQTGELGRDGVRAQFVPSAEFQSRVSAVVAAGCLS